MAFICSPSFAKSSSWTIDESHTTVEFEIAHLVFSTVKGKFNKFGGNISFDPDNITAAAAKNFALDVTIDVASIDTGNDKRDAHLRNDDFFDVAKFGNIRFKSTSVKVLGKSNFEVKGDLTIKGVTKTATLKTKFLGSGVAWGVKRAAFKATTSINRKDFGLVWNKLVEVGPVVGDEVDIALTVEAKQTPSGPKKTK